MKLLNASVLVLALILAACDGAVSPTEPQLIESAEVDARPDNPVPGVENPEPDGRREGDDSE